MQTHATLSELEETIFGFYAAEDKYIFPAVADVAQHLGKTLLPSEKIDKRISEYASVYSQEAASFRLRTIPRTFRSMVQVALQPEAVDNWAEYKEAYDGSSAIDLLSVLEPQASKKNIQRVYETFSNMRCYLTVLHFPSFEDFHYLMRLAQYEQLGLQ